MTTTDPLEAEVQRAIIQARQLLKAGSVTTLAYALLSNETNLRLKARGETPLCDITAEDPADQCVICSVRKDAHQTNPADHEFLSPEGAFHLCDPPSRATFEKAIAALVKEYADEADNGAPEDDPDNDYWAGWVVDVVGKHRNTPKRTVIDFAKYIQTLLQ